MFLFTERTAPTAAGAQALVRRPAPVRASRGTIEPAVPVTVVVEGVASRPEPAPPSVDR